MGFTLLAFDFGTKNIGVAVGQSITATAQALPPIKADQGIPNWKHIEKYLQEWQPHGLVVGLPLNMDGSFQNITGKANKFASRLRGRFNLPVFMHDERLTTVSAKEEIFAQGGYKSLQKDKIDSISACLILESWFNENSDFSL